jgi:hypothetical protein
VCTGKEEEQQQQQQQQQWELEAGQQEGCLQSVKQSSKDKVGPEGVLRLIVERDECLYLFLSLFFLFKLTGVDLGLDWCKCARSKNSRTKVGLGRGGIGNLGTQELELQKFTRGGSLLSMQGQQLW